MNRTGSVPAKAFSRWVRTSAVWSWCESLPTALTQHVFFALPAVRQESMSAASCSPSTVSVALTVAADSPVVACKQVMLCDKWDSPWISKNSLHVEARNLECRVEWVARNPGRDTVYRRHFGCIPESTRVYPCVLISPVHHAVICDASR